MCPEELHKLSLIKNVAGLGLVGFTNRKGTKPVCLGQPVPQDTHPTRAALLG